MMGENAQSNRTTFNKPIVGVNRPDLDMNSKNYFAYSPHFLMKKTLTDNNQTSIFKDKNKVTKPKAKESSKNNYYKNYLVNTENFFTKTDSGNGSKSTGAFKLKEFNNLIEGSKPQEKFITLGSVTSPTKINFGKITTYIRLLTIYIDYLY